jgi:hypothetical protein
VPAIAEMLSANKPEIATMRNAPGSRPGVGNCSIAVIKAWRAARMIWCEVRSSSARCTAPLRSIRISLV